MLHCVAGVPGHEALSSTCFHFLSICSLSVCLLSWHSPPLSALMSCSALFSLVNSAIQAPRLGLTGIFLMCTALNMTSYMSASLAFLGRPLISTEYEGFRTMIVIFEPVSFYYFFCFLGSFFCTWRAAFLSSLFSLTRSSRVFWTGFCSSCFTSAGCCSDISPLIREWNVFEKLGIPPVMVVYSDDLK